MSATLQLNRHRRPLLCSLLLPLCCAVLCCSCRAAPYNPISSDEIPHDCDIPTEQQGWYSCKVHPRQRAPSVSLQNRVRPGLSAASTVAHTVHQPVLSLAFLFCRDLLRDGSFWSASLRMSLHCRKTYCSKVKVHPGTQTDSTRFSGSC